MGGIALATALLCAGVAWAASGSLTFIELEKDTVAGVAGMNAPLDVAVSPDGKNVYVAGSGSNAVATFTRDTATGALTFLEQDVDGSGGVDGLQGAFGVAVSPDGKNVYVAGKNENSLAIFNRDLGTGALTYVTKQTQGGGVDGLLAPWGVTVSPDGKNVYVAAQGEGAIGTFTRDTSTGLLNYLEVDQDGVGSVDGLGGITNVEVSPLPGTNLYGASCGSDNAVPVFTRDPGTGSLTFLEVHKDNVGGADELNCSRDVTVSPDGANVYSVAESDDSVTSFTRSASNGALTVLEADVDDTAGVDGLNGARDVAIAPDCGTVYVGGAVDDAVAGFSRDPTTGALSFVEQKKDNAGGVDGIDQAVGVAVSPDNASVYATGEFDDAVAAFSREVPPTSCQGSSPPPSGPASRTVTLSASKKKVKKGKKVTLSGDIASADIAGCEAGQSVTLQRKGAKDKNFKTRATLTTDGSGGFVSKQKLKKTAQFRATVAAGSACGAAESAPKKVKVKKKKKRH